MEHGFKETQRTSIAATTKTNDCLIANVRINVAELLL